MKCALLVVALAVAATAQTPRTLDDDLRLFGDFKQTFNRQYSPSEEVHRFECFRKTLNDIDRRNGQGAERHGVNMFADLCADEFARLYLGLRFNGTSSPANLYTESQIVRGQSVDWRMKGAVTPVKNQGRCGSCWSFSATGNMEGQHFLAGHTLVGLSEEELVQCSHNGDMGCNGGLMDNAFAWVVQNGGIDSESDYPYTSGSGITGMCDTSKKSNVVAKYSGYHDLPHSEDQMATWVFSHGPLSIGVDAAQGWQTYSGGIMQNCFGRQLDHGVLIVGFDDNNSPPYWVVKNSWTASWGENGYIRLAKGSNQCGLTMAPSSSTSM